jgi:hypothetical protein
MQCWLEKQYPFLYSCGNPPTWIIEDQVSGEVRAACDRHVALSLFDRVNLVVSVEEDGPEMIKKKGQLNESGESDAR